MAGWTRRKWLSGVAGMALSGITVGQSTTVPKRPLGKTGVQVPVLAIGGGSAFMAMNEDEAGKFLWRALELGLTYWDTAHSYGNGASEIRMGRVLKTERAKVFLATKTAARSYDGAMRQVELSLKRLQTDHLDLIQMHDWRPNDDPVAISKKDGVLTALRKLREEKVVRFIGLTGHTTPDGMRKVLELYDDLDTVLMPINPAQPDFETTVIPTAQKKGVAVLAMKVTGRRSLLDKAPAPTLLRYAWSAPIAAAVVGMTGVDILETDTQLALHFVPMSESERTQLRQRLRAMRDHLPYLIAGYRDGQLA
ncbi:General stress protein 69 [bacterium HR17]|uniref:General stress protein 69 n=1 Tax=Candidatus Fervidibacter japonicus TaxID=2035412 RepID=A0A2H5XB79_9BACT|nr:General stress protein 69 [bacterium HR17]